MVARSTRFHLLDAVFELCPVFRSGFGRRNSNRRAVRPGVHPRERHHRRRQRNDRGWPDSGVRICWLLCWRTGRAFVRDRRGARRHATNECASSNADQHRNHVHTGGRHLRSRGNCRKLLRHCARVEFFRPRTFRHCAGSIGIVGFCACRAIAGQGLTLT